MWNSSVIGIGSGTHIFTLYGTIRIFSSFFYIIWNIYVLLTVKIHSKLCQNYETLYHISQKFCEKRKNHVFLSSMVNFTGFICILTIYRRFKFKGLFYFSSMKNNFNLYLTQFLNIKKSVKNLFYVFSRKLSLFYMISTVNSM